MVSQQSVILENPFVCKQLWPKEKKKRGGQDSTCKWAKVKNESSFWFPLLLGFAGCSGRWIFILFYFSFFFQVFFFHLLPAPFVLKQENPLAFQFPLAAAKVICNTLKCNQNKNNCFQILSVVCCLNVYNDFVSMLSVNCYRS